VRSSAKRVLSAALLIAALSFGLPFLMRQSGKQQFRSCGHRIRLVDKLPDWVPFAFRKHACSARKLVSELKYVGLGLTIFFNEHRRTATNLHELQTDGVLPFTLTFAPQMIYKTDGSNWTVTVPKTAQLPGDYLLMPSGDIFFSETGPAKESDHNLATQPNLSLPRSR
jgi:hypothetical protein